MSEVFLKILNMSITASWLVLAVFILRLVLKKAPKWSCVLLWGIVALRLLVPFSVESMFSLIPSTQTIPLNIEFDTSPAINSGIPVINNMVNPIISQTNTPKLGASVNPLQIAIALCANFWILGIAAMLLYTLISYLYLRHRVGSAVLYRDNIFQSENVESPFVLGIIKPRIYIPFGLDEQSLAYVVAHEQAHIRRRDHWWKPFGFLLLAMYWFNPVMWLAYVLFCRDIELACDEKVIREMDNVERADYSQALLNCSINRRLISACPLAFGEVGVRARIKSVLHYKKPAFWIVVLAVLSCGVTAVCFLTDPVTVRNPWVQEYEPGSENSIGNVDKTTYESISADFAIGADKYGRAVFKDPEKAFDTMKELYADGIALIREEQGLGALSRRNYDLYKKFGWQVTGGTAHERDQAAFVSRFLDIYENSFTKDTPDTNPPSPTLEGNSADGMNILGSHISEEKLSYDELKKQQQEIWSYKSIVYPPSESELIKFQNKIQSVGCSPGDQYVTVQVLHFTDEDIARFTSLFKNFSYVLVEVKEPLETVPETLFGTSKTWFYDTAWEIAEQTAVEHGLTLDRNTGNIIYSASGEYVGVEFYETDRIRHVRIAFYRDKYGNYNIVTPDQFSDVPASLLNAAYKTACDSYDGILSDSPFAIRGSREENYLEIVFQAADRYMFVGVFYIPDGENWVPMPGTPTVIYEPTRWDHEESLIISVAFDYSVPQAVMDWAAELIHQEIENHNLLNSHPAVPSNIGYSIVGAKITGLKKLAEAEAESGDDCAVEIYLLEYRLKPDKPENIPMIEGMIMEDGWITESVRGNQPYLVLHRNSTSGTDVYTRITTADSGMISESADEETMELYYTELAKDLYEAWIQTQEVTFTGIITNWNIASSDTGISVLDLNIVEFISWTDTERIAELELEETEMPNGYYIYDEDDSTTLLTIPANAEFVFYDWWDIFNPVEDPRYTVADGRWITTSDVSVFATYLETYDPYPGMPFNFTVKEDKLTVQEIFVP